MAKTPTSSCSCVIDTHGLHALATASGNLKGALIAKMQDGTIGVPTWAWQEFEDLYEEEATALKPQIVSKIQISQPVRVRVARITEELRLGFSRGAYDDHVERHTAAVALNKGYTVLTSADNVPTYKAMKCAVREITEWMHEVG